MLCSCLGGGLRPHTPVPLLLLQTTDNSSLGKHPTALSRPGVLTQSSPPRETAAKRHKDAQGVALAPRHVLNDKG